MELDDPPITDPSRRLLDRERVHVDAIIAKGRGVAVIEALPELLDRLVALWSLRLETPFEHGGTCSWVCPATRYDGTPAVLKLAMPHMEGKHEIQGLRYWRGGAMVRLLEADDDSGAVRRGRSRVHGRSWRESAREQFAARGAGVRRARGRRDAHVAGCVHRPGDGRRVGSSRG